MNLIGSPPLFLLVPILTGLDFMLLPFFVAIFTAIFIFIRNRRYKNDVVARYFIPALLFRFAGAFLTALMYQYYYGYGDTFYYFQGVHDIFNAFISNPMTGIEMITLPYELYSEEAINALTLHGIIRQTSAGVVIRTGGFFSIFTFGSYLGVSFGMTIIAFVGCWMLYRVFQDIYPHLHFPLALGILFVPSLCFWGTGVMKDPLSLGGAGMFVYGLYFIVFKRTRGLLLPLLAMVIGLYFAIRVKVYIVLALMPAALVWIIFLYKEKIRNKTLRMLAGPFLLIFGGLFGLLALQQLGSVFQNFAIENIVEEAAKTQWWLTVSTERDGGTGYTLGIMEPTLTGMLKIFPAAVNVALFRPYLWEARKIIVMPSAMEALFTFLFTLYVFFKVGIIKTLREMLSNPTVLFCLIFSVIFAFAVGFTSMNFGALARYKIPALPFFFSALIILLDSKNALPIAAQHPVKKQTQQKKRNPAELPLQ